MSQGFRWSRLLLAAALAGQAAACSSLPRTNYTEAEAEAATVPGMVGVRAYADATAADFVAMTAGPQKKRQAFNYLALSGGGGDGAYGAGVLNGWTASGKRPDFTIVSGVSTGALIAPFAFLGPGYDSYLTDIYTSGVAESLVQSPSIANVLFGSGLFGDGRLRNLIARYVTPELLQAIAEEHAKGRRLLVVTTNLDSQRAVIWNMGAIASSNDPRATELFRKILLASASIPGAFPPVMIDVNVGGTAYQEMHVDGGTVTQVFLYPPSFSVAGAPQRKRVLYVIRNARMDADWASTERRTMTIAMRAIDSLTRTQGIGDLYRIYATTNRDGIDFNLTYIPPSFNVPHTEQFDTNYMRSLYDVGLQAAKVGYQWQKYPPGFDAPMEAQLKK